MSEALLDVLVLKVELDRITLEVCLDDTCEDLVVLNEVLVDQLDLKVCVELLVQDFHRLQSAAC